MKRAAILLLCLTLAGCGLFRKTKDEKHTTEENTQQGSQSQKTETDNGNSQTKEVFKFKMPVNMQGFDNGAKLPGYTPGAYPPDAGMQDLKNNLVDMQGKNQTMAGTIGYLEGELTRYINDQRSKSTTSSTSDTLNHTSSKSDSLTTKSPAIPWYVILGGIIILLMVWDGIKMAFRKFILKK